MAVILPPYIAQYEAHSESLHYQLQLFCMYIDHVLELGVEHWKSGFINCLWMAVATGKFLET